MSPVIQFAARLLTIAHAPESKGHRFGSKVFLGYLADEMRLGRGRFEELLIEANADGYIRLSRADLRSVMNQNEVDHSEVRHPMGTAVFHFLNLD